MAVSLHRRTTSQQTRLLVLLFIVALLISTSGCTRCFYRWRADCAVDELMCEKDKYPQWKLMQYHIYPDPRSRFADWTNWDRPPRPPDDPAAYKMAPNPQPTPLAGIQYIEGTGYLDMMAYFDTLNRTRRDQEKQNAGANPLNERRGEELRLPGQTQSATELDQEIDESIERELNPPVTTTDVIPEDKMPKNPESCRRRVYLLNLEQVVQLGFLNNRELQTAREQLYLTALQLTIERFAFVAQPFLFGNFFREQSGRQAIDPGANRWVANTTAGFTKFLSTGGLLLLNFANQTVYNLGRNPGPTSVSTINFDFIQPFLLGAGRAIALEPLTQAERNLLYAIRDFRRLTTEYFVFFAAGQAVFVPGVGAGVLAFTPVTTSLPGAFIPGPTAPASSNLNPASIQVFQSSTGLNVPTPGSTPTPQGYLTTITERAQLVNFYKNIQALRRFLNLFEVFLEGGLISQVQKGLVEQQLLNSISTVLGTHVTYRVSLDQLKTQLGLPMTLAIDLDDAPLRPVIRLTQRYEELSFNSHRLSRAIDDLGRMAEYRRARAGLDELLRTQPLLRGTQSQKGIQERLDELRKVIAREKAPVVALRTLYDRINQQREAMRQQQRELRGRQQTAEEQRAYQDVVFDFDVVRFELALTVYEQAEWLQGQYARDPVAQQNLQALLFRAVKRNFLGLANYAFGETQAAIKRSWPALPPICADGVDVLSAPEDVALGAVMRVALENRWDLMNVRAQLVDSWRKIRVTANSLLGVFNVDYHLDSSTPPGENKPFTFGGSRTRHELVFNWTVPWVRVIQRNNYRSALIAFQQIRRQVMLREDQLLFDVRFDLRNVRAGAYNIQVVQKRNIELAFMQVDQALEQFSAPAAPIGADPVGLVGPVGPRPVAGDPAALTQQLLGTQNSLLTARNNLYNTWTGYLIQRMNVYRDLQIMQLDPTGVWIDNQQPCNCTENGQQQQPSQQSAQQPPGDQQPPNQPEELPTPRPREPEQLPPGRPVEAAPGPEMEPPN